jgi:hypothetical protein
MSNQPDDLLEDAVIVGFMLMITLLVIAMMIA